MDTLIHKVAALAYVDKQISYLQDEYGDLPEQIESQKEQVTTCEKMVNETTGILQELKDFVNKAKTTLVDLKTKEENLAKQQFQVRNNKEFDAITSEIKHLNLEHSELSDKLRQEGIKEENLTNILEKQKTDLASEQKKLEDLEAELADVSSEQDDELKELTKKRDSILKKIDQETIDEYNRIGQYHREAAVQVVKGSCRGYKIPSQRLVEIRNNMDRIFVDEHTGRILIPEEITIDESLVESIAD